MHEGPWKEHLIGAVFSPDRIYRYALWRIWNRYRPLVCFICLNGSKADEVNDDHSVRKFIGFANTLDYGGILIGNAFGFRTQYPKILRQASQPIGPDNDEWIRKMSADAVETIVGWGNHGAYLNRSHNINHLFKEPVSCFGYTKSGEPKHPLYLSYYAPLISYGIGMKGIRDGHSICREFEPDKSEIQTGSGCQTDGHYLCKECKHRDITAVESG